ncbi:hypothetical protein [Nitratireductor sp. GCM10026969]|uniref:hypothetical protein n=1 Tax=Nitratireductor sp. GCM10026969 TaxID=3252645 RepID=UPI003613306B
MISKELEISILALDSYYRGEGPGSFTIPGSRIGNARIRDTDLPLGSHDAGFYAVAYEWNGQTIISYRGTDTDDLAATASDAWNGWRLGAGFPDTSQGRLAIEFYESVLRQINDDPVLTVYDDAPHKPLLVGHSLGGGLAGFVSLLSGTQAEVFDHMPFGAAAMGAIGSEVERRVAAMKADGRLPDDFHYDTLTPELLQSLGMHMPNFGKVNAMHVKSEIGEGLRDGSIALKLGVLGTELTAPFFGPLASYFGYKVSTGQSEAEQKIDYAQLETFGWDGGAVARHSLVTLLYAKENHGDNWHAVADSILKAFFDEEVAWTTSAVQTWVTFETQPADAISNMQAVIAYSALEEGGLPFGNTGIRAIFNDADQLGRLVSAPDASMSIKDLAPAIAKFMVAYGGILAFEADKDAAHCEGILSISGDTATVSVTGPEWAFTGSPMDAIGGKGLHSCVEQIGDYAFALRAENAPTDEALKQHLTIGYYVTNAPSYIFSTSTGDSEHDVPPSTPGNTSVFIGGEGNETVTSKSAAALISTGAGNDVIFSNGRNDLILAGAGDDVVFRGGNDSIEYTQLYGGDGIDRADYSNLASKAVFSLYDDDDRAGAVGKATVGVSSDRLYDFEHLVGTRCDDVFEIEPLSSQTFPSYIIDGDGGRDRIRFLEEDRTVSVDLAKGKATIEELLGPGVIEIDLLRIDQVIAGDGNDVLTGNERDNLLEGKAGADILDGGAGDDILVGGYGADRFILGNGRDVIQDFNHFHGDRLVGSGSFTDTTFEEHHAVEVAGTIIDDPYNDAAYYNDLAAQGMIWA